MKSRSYYAILICFLSRSLSLSQLQAHSSAQQSSTFFLRVACLGLPLPLSANAPYIHPQSPIRCMFGLASHHIFLSTRDAAVEWTALLLRNREILDSNLGPDAVYLEFSWFSSIFTGKNTDIVSGISTRQLPPKPFPIYYID